jgi:hypothetical protein
MYSTTHSKKIQGQSFTPCSLSHSGGIGIQPIRTTPLQFFSQQEPVASDQNANLRSMYKRSFVRPNTTNDMLEKRYIGRLQDSDGRMARIKSINIGKYAYNTTVPNTQLSSKSYDTNIVRSTLARVRNH